MLQPDLAMQCGHQLSGGVFSSSTLSSLQHIVQPLQPRPGTMSTCSVMPCLPRRWRHLSAGRDAINQMGLAANAAPAHLQLHSMKLNPALTCHSSSKSDQEFQGSDPQNSFGTGKHRSGYSHSDTGASTWEEAHAACPIAYHRAHWQGAP